MNIPSEERIIASLCNLNYLKGVITGTISNDIPYKEYTDCIRYCNSLITLLQDMLEDEKEGE